MSRLQKVVKGILLYYKYQPLILTIKNSFIALFFHLNVSNETTCSNFKVSWRGRPSKDNNIFTFLVTVMVVISDSDSIDL